MIVRDIGRIKFIAAIRIQCEAMDRRLCTEGNAVAGIGVCGLQHAMMYSATLVNFHRRHEAHDRLVVGSRYRDLQDPALASALRVCNRDRDFQYFLLPLGKLVEFGVIRIKGIVAIGIETETVNGCRCCERQGISSISISGLELATIESIALINSKGRDSHDRQIVGAVDRDRDLLGRAVDARDSQCLGRSLARTQFLDVGIGVVERVAPVA